MVRVENILDYLPHREPMVMLDGVEIDRLTVLCPEGRDRQSRMDNAQCTVVYATLLVKETNWFYADGVLTESGLMEHMAQSVCVQLQVTGDRGQVTDSPKIGYLAEVKNMTIRRLPVLNEQLRTRIEVIAVVDEAIVVSAETQVQGETIAEGMLTIFVPDSDAERRAQ